MNRKLAASLTALSLFTLGTFASVSSTAFADQTPPPATAPAPDQNASRSAHESAEHSRPQHHVDEDREAGFEGIQLVLVGAAVVVALGLAYRAGRRRRES